MRNPTKKKIENVLSQAEEIEFVREQFQQILDRRDRLISKQEEQIKKLQKLLLTRTHAYDELARKMSLNLSQSNLTETEKQDIIQSFMVDANNDASSASYHKPSKDSTVSTEFQLTSNEINSLKLDFTKKIAILSGNIGQHCKYLKSKSIKDKKTINNLENQINQCLNDLNGKQTQIEKLQIEKEYWENEYNKLKSKLPENAVDIQAQQAHLQTKEMRLVIADLENECTQLNKIINQERANDKKNQIDVDNLSVYKPRKTSNIATANNINANLKTNLVGLEKQQLMKEIHAFQFESDNNTPTILPLLEQIQSLKQERSNLMKQIDSLQQTIDEKNKEIENLSNQLHSQTNSDDRTFTEPSDDE